MANVKDMFMRNQSDGESLNSLCFYVGCHIAFSDVMLNCSPFVVVIVMLQIQSSMDAKTHLYNSSAV